ncbi:MAG: hypothetical protein EOM24_32645 [Chloroflexia bacterium]|nr:hypothetical protein [Chloroflexia bacterium]
MARSPDQKRCQYQHDALLDYTSFKHKFCHLEGRRLPEDCTCPAHGYLMEPPDAAVPPTPWLAQDGPCLDPRVPRNDTAGRIHLMPAHAGIPQMGAGVSKGFTTMARWMPACAGMTWG